MRTVEAKLADWHRLYKELAQAQSRLKDGDQLPPADPTRAGLEAEVERLQRDCDSALELVQNLLHSRKPTAGAQPQRTAA